MAYEIYQRAKTFGKLPSDVALFDDSVVPLVRWYFDRGIWAWGEHVIGRLAEAGHGGNPAFAASRREAVFLELMGGDVSSAYAAPDAAAPSRQAGVDRRASNDDDDRVFEGTFVNSDML